MTQRYRLRLIAVTCIAIDVFSSLAMAEPAMVSANAPLFNSVPPRGKQIALDEAMALNLAVEHIHNADQIAAQMFAEINNSTTGWFGSIMLYFPRSAASILETSSQDFRSEAATAFVEITLLDNGIENSISDTEYKRKQQAANSMFTLRNGASPAQYHMQLQGMLQTLHETAKVAATGFKAKWGVSFAEALPH